MAAPINLKANTPGGNSYGKSAKAQKPLRSKPVPIGGAIKPQLRTDKGKRVGGAGVKPAYEASRAITVPKIVVDGKVIDYASQWMQSKGMKNAQNKGAVPRVPWANVPADGIGASTRTLTKSSRTASQPKPARRTTSKSSSGPTTSRVKSIFTGKAFKSGRPASKPKFRSSKSA